MKLFINIFFWRHPADQHAIPNDNSESENEAVLFTPPTSNFTSFITNTTFPNAYKKLSQHDLAYKERIKELQVVISNKDGITEQLNNDTCTKIKIELEKAEVDDIESLNSDPEGKLTEEDATISSQDGIFSHVGEKIEETKSEISLNPAKY